ncbi:hypothetical protein ACRRTK_012258 [Alexandromys fortis]
MIISRLAPNQPPPPLIRPALAASRHSARPGPQPPPTLIGASLEPPCTLNLSPESFTVQRLRNPWLDISSIT